MGTRSSLVRLSSRAARLTAGPITVKSSRSSVPILPNITGPIDELHETKRLTLLAVNAPARHPSLPDVPTAPEAGLPNMITQNIFGAFGPAGLPQAIIKQVSDATQAALADPVFQKKLALAGFEPLPGLDPAASAALVKQDWTRWEGIVKSANIKE